MEWLVVVATLAPALAWLIFRNHGYKRRLLDRSPGAAWRRTDEAFVDPTSGETVRVWSEPDSGERAYVRDGPG